MRVKHLNCLMLFMIFILLSGQTLMVAGDVVVSGAQKINLSGNDILKVEPNMDEGFNFPFYLFIPETIDKNQKSYLLVETNNTGTASDDFEVHLKKALRQVSRSYPNRIARKLNVPLLVPVFPRPRTNWQAYTHALDRDSLEIKEGRLKRIDLQLVAMIDYAHQLLQVNGIQMHDQIFMHGFSASAKFCNRFAFLHPELVKTAVAGGVNGLPMLPICERNGHTLPFPIGVADIREITGQPYNKEAHQRVAQYIYMGYFDRNDTLPSRDAWSEDEAFLIREAVAAQMMPERWGISQAVCQQELPRVQCVTYNGVAHTIKAEMLDDIVKFFRSNSGNAFVEIKPHVYPFVEYRELTRVHVNGLYYKGDSNIPEFVENDLQEGVVLIGIKEWLAGQGHRQLDEFVKHAGFNFILRAEGKSDIVITGDNYGGNSSTGDGSFQGFHANFNVDQLKTLTAGIPYTLHPQNKSDKYIWLVNDNVTLVNPHF